ncbi:MAG: hypothetical protein ACPGRC_05285 [Salibacteraceae bacterium]
MKNTLIILSLFAFIGCHSSKETVTQAKSTKTKQEVADVELTVDEPRDSTSILPMMMNESYDMTQVGDPYQILTAKIEDDILWLTVSYGGGCREHEFELHFNDMYIPRKDQENGTSGYVNLTLHHNGNDDRCRSIVQQNIRFDLKPLKNSSYKNILIRISKYNEELNLSN